MDKRVADVVEQTLYVKRWRRWRKWPDIPLGVHVEAALEHRQQMEGGRGGQLEAGLQRLRGRGGRCLSTVSVACMAEAASTPRIRFRFELRPLAQAHPWGGDRRTLHWFGLTDGWYWIELNGHELLRYSDQTVRRWQADGYQDVPYVDYYVVRLWEDLLELLPAVLEPVPADLVPFIESRLHRLAGAG